MFFFVGLFVGKDESRADGHKPSIGYTYVGVKTCGPASVCVFSYVAAHGSGKFTFRTQRAIKTLTYLGAVTAVSRCRPPRFAKSLASWFVLNNLRKCMSLLPSYTCYLVRLPLMERKQNFVLVHGKKNLSIKFPNPNPIPNPRPSPQKPCRICQAAVLLVAAVVGR